jgi:hypothetical protein
MYPSAPFSHSPAFLSFPSHILPFRQELQLQKRSMGKSRDDVATFATADMPSTAGTPTAWQGTNNTRDASNSDARHWKHHGITSATAETPASRDPMGKRTAVIKQQQHDRQQHKRRLEHQSTPTKAGMSETLCQATAGTPTAAGTTATARTPETL